MLYVLQRFVSGTFGRTGTRQLQGFTGEVATNTAFGSVQRLFLPRCALLCFRNGLL